MRLFNYLLLCNKSSPNLVAQNNKHLLSHSFCGNRDTDNRCSLAGSLRLRLSGRLSSKYWQGLQLSQSSTGGSPLPIVLVWLLAGLVSFPHRSLHPHPENPLDMAAGHPRMLKPEQGSYSS